MELIQYFIDFILHIDIHLEELIRDHGAWIYAILFLIIFCETGLVITPFLPGDSLLFVAGTLAAIGSNHINIHVMVTLLILSAILGDTCNYFIGKFFGEKLFRNPHSRIFKRKYLQRTHGFYEKHGGKTIILARFVPVVRTFAPFVAGMGRMNYRHFFIYNITGGICWVILFMYAGYFFGNIPVIRNNLSFFALAIIFISILPGVIEIIKHRIRKKK
jgi:membrane-associated protein